MDKGSHVLQALRVAWAAEGLHQGFIGLDEFNDYVALADVLGETGPRWWEPRYDQPWRRQQARKREVAAVL
jgi:hypothetical protein